MEHRLVYNIIKYKHEDIIELNVASPTKESVASAFERLKNSRQALKFKNIMEDD